MTKHRGGQRSLRRSLPYQQPPGQTRCPSPRHSHPFFLVLAGKVRGSVPWATRAVAPQEPPSRPPKSYLKSSPQLCATCARACALGAGEARTMPSWWCRRPCAASLLLLITKIALATNARARVRLTSRVGRGSVSLPHHPRVQRGGRHAKMMWHRAVQATHPGRPARRCQSAYRTGWART